MNKFTNLLKAELAKRQKKNERYSLRAFAIFLQTSPATLSQVMLGKRGASIDLQKQILKKLGLSPSETAEILYDETEPESNETFQLQNQVFEMMSSWHFLAIISLGELPDFEYSARWIAKKIGITLSSASESLQRLEKLGIIENQKGKLKVLIPPFSVSSTTPSGAIQNYHKSILDVASLALENVPVDQRDYSSLVMAVNSKNLTKAIELTKKYKKNMMALLESGEKDSVYQLSIQLFPLSKEETK